MEHKALVFKSVIKAEKLLSSWDLWSKKIQNNLTKNGIAKIPNTVYIVVIDELGLLD